MGDEGTFQALWADVVEAEREARGDEDEDEDTEFERLMQKREKEQRDQALGVGDRLAEEARNKALKKKEPEALSFSLKYHSVMGKPLDYPQIREPNFESFMAEARREVAAKEAEAAEQPEQTEERSEAEVAAASRDWDTQLERTQANQRRVADEKRAAETAQLEAEIEVARGAARGLRPERWLATIYVGGDWGEGPDSWLKPENKETKPEGPYMLKVPSKPTSVEELKDIIMGKQLLRDKVGEDKTKVKIKYLDTDFKEMYELTPDLLNTDLPSMSTLHITVAQGGGGRRKRNRRRKSKRRTKKRKYTKKSKSKKKTGRRRSRR
jgi:hypothetical protein